MKRKIIKIDQERCDGCGACAAACHEGAIGMIGGKAHLLRDDYCDGLGDCLPACPTGAITFEEREAAPYDAKAVQAKREEKENALPCGCPGTAARALERPEAPAPAGEVPSELRQWPVQIQLVNVHAPYLSGADLLVAADCTAYACGDFHRRFIRGRVTLVGCPKLDRVDYSEKLTQILRENDIRSVTVARMEVPCCGGMELAVKKAIQQSGKFLPWHVVTISAQGEILSE